MKKYYLFLISCVCCFWLSPIATTHAASTAFAAGECNKDAPTERTVECGTMTLPLYADGSKPGTVELPIMIVRSTTPNKHLPLFLLQGGPGGDTIDTFQYLVKKPNSTLPTDRDLVFFEQRGTTNATPSLDCPEIYEQMITLLAKKSVALNNCSTTKLRGKPVGTASAKRASMWGPLIANKTPTISQRLPLPSTTPKSTSMACHTVLCWPNTWYDATLPWYVR